MLDISYWIRTFNFANPHSNTSFISNIILEYKSEHFYKKEKRFSDSLLSPNCKKHNIKHLKVYSKSERGTIITQRIALGSHEERLALQSPFQHLLGHARQKSFNRSQQAQLVSKSPTVLYRGCCS